MPTILSCILLEIISIVRIFNNTENVNIQTSMLQYNMDLCGLVVR